MKCDDDLLRDIIDDQLSDHENQDVTAHVSTCQRCQQRLTELAADGDSWNATAAALSDANADLSRSVVIAIDPELSAEIPFQADPISLDFLDPPSHPEMLGRIGRYEVERLIGAGGMGIVFKAFDTELHRPVAVKVLAPHLAHSGGARQRFAREAQSAAAIVHENVVPIHNVDAAGKLPFLVMQYVAGESVQARVDRDGPLSINETLRIGIQTAKGLAAAHDQGLVHRDVKPGNILTEEGIERVLISDFGLARAADDASVTRSGVIAGTPHYMSPEQATGGPIDGRCDLFSLGSVLYFMCTGSPPFRAEGAMAVLNRICHDTHTPVDAVNEQVPEPLADLIDQLLQKNPALRPDSATDVAHALTAVLLDARTGARRRSARRRAQAPKRIGRWILLTAASLLVAAAGFTFWHADWALWNDGRDERGIRPSATSHLSAGIENASEPPAKESEGEKAEPAQGPVRSAHNVDAAALMRSLDSLPEAEFYVELRGVEASVFHQETRDQFQETTSTSAAIDDWQSELMHVDALLRDIESGPE